MTAPTEAQRLVLLLPDGSRVPIGGSLTIGRGEDASIRIADPTVSRAHARISLGPEGPVIEDAGSRFGTTLSGNAVDGPTRLYPGAQIRVGDVVIGVAAAASAPPRLHVPSVEPGRDAEAPRARRDHRRAGGRDADGSARGSESGFGLGRSPTCGPACGRGGR